MRSEAMTAATTPGRSPSGSLVERVAALVEVLAAFAVVHFTYRSFKHFTGPGRAEGAAGLNFSAGATMVLVSVFVLLLFRREFARYGLTLKDWRYNLNVGLIWSLLIVGAAGLAIRFAGLRLDPIRPPAFRIAALATLAELISVCLLLLVLMRTREVIRRVHPFLSLLVLVALLLLPPLLAWRFNRPAVDALLNVLWLFFGAGFGEEILFRGYIQSRVDQSFGRPFRFLQVDFGFGLIVSSVLFGFIHVLNTVDYFAGRFDFAWLWGVTSFATGMFFGLLRQRTGSILAGGIVHGLTDVFARVPALLP